MRDCPNVTLRERLPDLLHDRLPAALRAEVHAHLNTCADCRAELELLQRIRATSVTVTVDTTRIVAALPAYRASSPWRRMAGSPTVRVAAAILLVAGGALLLTDRPVKVEQPTISPPVAVAPRPDTLTAPRDTTRSAVERRRPGTEAATELAVGEMFDDLTDNELKALLAALGTLQAVTPIETEVVVPAVNREGT